MRTLRHIDKHAPKIKLYIAEANKLIVLVPPTCCVHYRVTEHLLYSVFRCRCHCGTAYREYSVPEVKWNTSAAPRLLSELI